MGWLFKRRVSDEQYIPMFRRLVLGLRDVWARPDTGELDPSLPELARRYGALRQQAKDFRKVVPQREPWRPVHNALNRLVLYQLELMRRLVMDLELGQRGVLSHLQPGRVGRWEAESREELGRLIDALPESDPIRAIVNTAPGAHNALEVPTEETAVSPGELWLRFAYGEPDETYEGQVVLLSGSVRDVGDVSGTPYVLFESLPEEKVRCLFIESDAPRVAALSRGYDVTVRGTVVHGFRDRAVELHNCTLEAASAENIEVVTATELWAAYAANEAAADEKYKEKLARVTGVIRHIYYDAFHQSMWLEGGAAAGDISCMCAETEAEKVSSLSAGQTVTVIGRVHGKHTPRVTQEACVILGDCTLDQPVG